MNSKRQLIIVLFAVVALGAGFAAAQTTTHEVRQGTVLHTSGNQVLVELTDGSTKLFDVPSDFRFNVDGRRLSVGQLKPGTKLTETITVTTTPEVVKTVEVQNAEIIQRKGQTVIYRDAKTDKLHMVTGIPDGWVVFRDGKRVPIEALAGGDRVTAYIVHKETKMMTDEDIRVAGIAPETVSKPAAKPAARQATKPAARPAAMLPKTGSNLPLLGLAGLMILGLGLGISVLRRF